MGKNISSETLKQLLYSMKRIRFVEESIAAKYSEQKMRCPVHLSTGQETVSAAAGLVLRHSDLAVSGHRAHGHYIGKGGSVPRMLAEIYGKKTGCSSGKGGSMHLIDESVGFMGSTAIVGGTIPVGVGLGLSMKVQKTDQVAAIFLGDGAVEEGAFYEAANFAALKNLPVVFLCENNFYSVYSHLRVRQPEGRKIADMVKAMGMESSSADGNIAEETYSAIDAAVAKAREGRGPQFVEFIAYRWREHCGPNYDNHIGYRTEEEFQKWKAVEPIGQFESRLKTQGIIDDTWLAQVDSALERETMAAFEFAESSPFPEAQEAYADLYWPENQSLATPVGRKANDKKSSSHSIEKREELWPAN